MKKFSPRDMSVKGKICSCVIILLIAAIIVVLAVWDGGDDIKPEIRDLNTISINSIRADVDKNAQKHIVVIDTDIVKEELRNAGFLITQRYFFTGVATHSDKKEVLNSGFLSDLTESSFIYSYDGTVNAGVDLEKVSVSADNENRVVTVTVPHSVIDGTVIDRNSFQKYSEKNNIFNKISISDFADAEVELEKSAEEKAIASGILDRADEQAEIMILGLTQQIAELAGCTVEVVFAG